MDTDNNNKLGAMLEGGWGEGFRGGTSYSNI